MEATQRNPMDRLQTPKEWLRFVRNGAILTLVVAVVLFWNSPHTAEEISVAIAVPLIIFNCVPFILVAVLREVSALFPKAPQESLPFQPLDIKTVSSKQRMRAYALVGSLIFTMVCFFAGLAIFFASFTYAYLYIPWAVIPARHLSYLLLGVSILPFVALVSFLAGMHYSAGFRNSAVLHWIFAKAAHPGTYWPTTA